MARVKYYDSTTQTWKYADMALQTGIHVGTTAPTNEAMLWVDTASNQIDSFPLTDVQDSDGNSLIVNQIAVIPSMPSGTSSGDILVWDGTGWATKPSWQTVYQPVEYIAQSGKKYVDTQYYPQAGDVFTIDFKADSFPSSGTPQLSVFGAQNSGTGARPQVVIFGQSNTFQGAAYSFFDTQIPLDTNKHRAIIDSENGEVIFDGVTTNTFADTLQTTNSSIALYASRPGGSTPTDNSYYLQGKIYSLIIKNSGATVRNFIPVYNKFTAEIGFFEDVESKFYSMQGSGTVTKGADVN